MNQHAGLVDRISELKRKRNAVILAHNYQRGEVQDIADVTGDSLELSRHASRTEADVIVFCGVYFMAESASILNPARTVLLPSLEAGCPLADMITGEALLAWKKRYPGRPVITYINSSAGTKAESDICCTSSNAVEVVNSVDQEEVLFCPDMNLGHYVQARTEKKLVVWKGYCATHAWARAEEILEARELHPGALVVAHPECSPEVLSHADVIRSTSGMIAFTRESEAGEFIIVTEAGILHRLKKDNPGKRFYLGSKRLLCPNMKLTTLEKIAEALEKTQHVVKVPDDVRIRASRALERMLEIKGSAGWHD